jgi:hypothetical protein
MGWWSVESIGLQLRSWEIADFDQESVRGSDKVSFWYNICGMSENLKGQKDSCLANILAKSKYKGVKLFLYHFLMF